MRKNRDVDVANNRRPLRERRERKREDVSRRGPAAPRIPSSNFSSLHLPPTSSTETNAVVSIDAFTLSHRTGWEDIDNDKERFYFCIRHLHELDNLPEGFTEGIWAKLAQQSELAEMPSELKNKYIRNMTTEIDKRAQLKYAERKGREAGLAEGLEKGLAEGMEKGLEAGRAEGIEKVFEEKTSAARKMKEDGLSAETICRYIGLTLKQVAEL